MICLWKLPPIDETLVIVEFFFYTEMEFARGWWRRCRLFHSKFKNDFFVVKFEFNLLLAELLTLRVWTRDWVKFSSSSFLLWAAERSRTGISVRYDNLARNRCNCSENLNPIDVTTMQTWLSMTSNSVRLRKYSAPWEKNVDYGVAVPYRSLPPDRGGAVRNGKMGCDTLRHWFLWWSDALGKACATLLTTAVIMHWNKLF